MAKGLKVKVKAPPLRGVQDLLDPAMTVDLGPIGTMNMLQTIAMANKASEHLPVGAPVLKALSSDPKAMEKVRRLISEKETGLESPTRRKVLKGAAHLATHAAIPAPVEKALVKAVSAEGVPDESIQAAFAAHLRDKLDEYKNEDWYGKFSKDGDDVWDEYHATNDELPALFDVGKVASDTGLPVSALKGYLKRNKLNPDQILQDYRNRLADSHAVSIGGSTDSFEGPLGNFLLEQGPIARKFVKKGGSEEDLMNHLEDRWKNEYFRDLHQKLPLLVGKEAEPHVRRLNTIHDAFKEPVFGVSDQVPEYYQDWGINPDRFGESLSAQSPPSTAPVSDLSVLRGMAEKFGNNSISIIDPVNWSTHSGGSDSWSELIPDEYLANLGKLAKKPREMHNQLVMWIDPRRSNSLPESIGRMYGPDSAQMAAYNKALPNAMKFREASYKYSESARSEAPKSEIYKALQQMEKARKLAFK